MITYQASFGPDSDQPTSEEWFARCEHCRTRLECDNPAMFPALLELNGWVWVGQQCYCPNCQRQGADDASD